MREQFPVWTEKSQPNFYFRHRNQISPIILKFYSHQMQDPLRTPRLTKFILASLNFNALRDIETAVREGFRVGQKISFC